MNKYVVTMQDKTEVEFSCSDVYIRESGGLQMEVVTSGPPEYDGYCPEIRRTIAAFAPGQWLRVVEQKEKPTA